MSTDQVYILAIESSCDDTSAAVIHNGKMLSNVVANQKIHEAYGGVVPELASRAHQQNIVPGSPSSLSEGKYRQKPAICHSIYAWSWTNGFLISRNLLC